MLPGGEDPDAADPILDPILDAIELRDRGQPTRARALLEGVIEWDARCLDAHAQLGMTTTTTTTRCSASAGLVPERLERRIIDSYRGDVTVGLMVDAALVPDPGEIVTRL